MGGVGGLTVEVNSRTKSEEERLFVSKTLPATSEGLEQRLSGVLCRGVITLLPTEWLKTTSRKITVMN